MSKNVPIVVLLSSERSGTHFLRSILSNTGLFHTPGEVANASIPPEEVDESYFFDFSWKFMQKNGGNNFRSIETTHRMVNEYLDFLERIAERERRTLLCDLKYSHVHNFNHFWSDPHSRPFLLDILAERQIPVAHLIRRSVGHTAFSGIYARHTSVWNTMNVSDIKDMPITLERDEMQSEIRRIGGNINLFSAWLSEYANTHVVNYEDLVKDSRKTVNKLTSNLGLGEVEVCSSDFRKVTGKYKDIVSNFDEVKDLIGYNAKAN